MAPRNASGATAPSTKPGRAACGRGRTKMSSNLGRVILRSLVRRGVSAFLLGGALASPALGPTYSSPHVPPHVRHPHAVNPQSHHFEPHASFMRGLRLRVQRASRRAGQARGPIAWAKRALGARAHKRRVKRVRQFPVLMFHLDPLGAFDAKAWKNWPRHCQRYPKPETHKLT